MTMTTSPGSGDQMYSLLNQAFDKLEPLPPRLRQQAYDAFSITAFEDALAELLFDSSLAAPMLLRAPENEARLLSFANDFLTLDVSLLTDSDAIIGDTQPPISGELVLECRDGSSQRLVLDEFGRFRANCNSSSFRFRVVGHLITPWITR